MFYIKRGNNHVIWKEKSFADKYFFDIVKKETKNLNKDLKQTNDYVKDIDGMKKIYEKDKSPEETVKMLFFREDEPILTILYRIAILYNNKKINIEKNEIEKLLKSNDVIYDRILNFISYLLEEKIEMSGRREIYDMQLVWCKNMCIMEKNRIKYIKKNTEEGILSSIQLNYKLNTFLIILNDYIEERGTENVIDTILYVLNGLPEGYYDKIFLK